MISNIIVFFSGNTTVSAKTATDRCPQQFPSVDLVDGDRPSCVWKPGVIGYQQEAVQVCDMMGGYLGMFKDQQMLQNILDNITFNEYVYKYIIFVI